MAHQSKLARSSRLLVAAVALVWSPAILWAQQADQTQPPIGPVWNASANAPFAALLAQLDSPDFAERDSATQQLAAIRDALRLSLRPVQRNLFDAFVLESATRADLSPEQRARLAIPIRDKFFNTPRAAMGINIQKAMSVGIPIIPQAGFPCSKEGRLKPGDILTEIDGVSLERRLPDLRLGNDVSFLLRFAILSHEPGEIIPVLVRRAVQRADGRPGGEFQLIRLNIPLGAWDDLGQRPVDRMSLQGAWQHYKRKLGVEAKTIEPNLLIPSTTSNAKWEANRMSPGTVAPPSITIGSPHAGANESFYNELSVASALRRGGQSTLLIGPNNMVRPGAQLRVNQRRAIPTPEVIRQRKITQQRSHSRTLQRNLANIQTLIATAKSRLEDPQVFPQDRRAIENNLATLTAQAKAFERLLGELKVSIEQLLAPQRLAPENIRKK